MKIIPPSLPNGYVIFCDDVREEVRSKFTFVGIYGSEMKIFGTAPATVPKLCVAIKFRDDPETLPKHVLFRITKETISGTEVLLDAPCDVPALPEGFEFPDAIGGDGTRFVEIGLNSEFNGLSFSEKTTLRVRAIIGEEEYRIGALTVKLAPPSEAAQA